MRNLFILSFLLASATAVAQPRDTTIVQGNYKLTIKKEYSQVEVKPKFNGNMNEFLIKNLKITEPLAPGTKVVADFLIDTLGVLHDIKIVKQNPKAPLTHAEKEVLRVVKKMPPWIPGQRNGQNVAVKYSLPIHLN